MCTDKNILCNTCEHNGALKECPNFVQKYTCSVCLAVVTRVVQIPLSNTNKKISVCADCMHSILKEVEING